MNGFADIYLRMSEDRTGEQAGHDRQLADCQAEAARRGLTVRHVHQDTESATTGARRGGFEALLAARPPAIICWHEDRLIRTTKDLERVIALNVNVYPVMSGRLDLSTPTGRAVARTVTAWSQYETEHKAERQRAANRQRAERGQPWVSSVRTFGYTNGLDQVEAGEAERVIEAFGTVLAGRSLRGLAAAWRVAGVTNTSGRVFDSRRLVELVRRPIYAGRRHYRGVDVGPCTSPALVTLDTWGAVQAILADPARKNTDRGGRGPLCLLSGIAMCGRCGGKMMSGVGTSNSGEHRRYRTLVCRSCHGLGRKEEPIEIEVVAHVVARLRRPDMAALFLPAAPDLGPLQARAAGLRAQREALATDIDVALDFAAARDRRLREELAAVETEIADRSQGGPLSAFRGNRDPGDVWEVLDLATKRAVVRSLVDVVVLPVPRGARIFDPESVRFEWHIPE